MSAAREHRPSNRKDLKYNPDYQRLLRYQQRERNLMDMEDEATNKGDINSINIARGLLYNVRYQISELEHMLGLPH